MIDLDGPAGLFVSLAAVDAYLGAINDARGSAVPAATRALFERFEDRVDLLPPVIATIEGYGRSADPLAGILADLARATLLHAVNADTDRYLPAADVPEAVGAVIDAMRARGLAVRPNGVAAGITPAGDIVGDAAVVASGRDGLGRATQLRAAEVLVLTCLDDAATGGVAAGAEPLGLRGLSAFASPTDAGWPGPSGTSLSLRAVDPGSGPGRAGGSLVLGGEFDTWASGAPVGWSVVAGAPQVGPGSPAYSQGAALAISGGGSALPELRQALPGPKVATAPRPATAYGLAFWGAMAGATPPATGSLEVALLDATTGEVLADAEGATSRAAWDLTLAADAPGAWGPAYAPRTAVLRTPPELPAGGVVLSLQLAAPLPAGSTLLVDRLTLAPLVYPYAGGIGLAVAAGATPLRRGDRWTVVTTNDRSGRWQTLFDRYFGTREAGLLLPTIPGGSALDDLLA